MSHVSMLTLAQENVSVPSGAPAQPAPGAPAPAAPGAPVLGPGPAGAPGIPVTQTPSGTAPAAPAPSSGGGGQLFFVVALVGLLLFFMWSGNRRDKKKQEETMNSLKKGSKITTVGGLIANVVEVRETEIVVESSGTRLTFSKAAVQTVTNDDAAK
jgi:preprotein translocase subunit YajC